MNEVKVLPIENYGYGFVPSGELAQGKDEYWMRNEYHSKPLPAYRKLHLNEVDVLVKNKNYSTNWDNFLVVDPFDPNLICNSNFYGLIRLGTLSNILLQHHDFIAPAGIRNSTIISSDIGNNCAIQDCLFISHYIIGDMVILSRIDEMQTTNHSKFGNGVLAPGEKEDVRIWIDVMNEAGGRSILPFEDMITSDAYLWAAFRDDKALCEYLTVITQKQYGRELGTYGTVGASTVIKSTGVIKDTAIGSCAYIKGANKLKNITILSSEEESTQIGEGVELVNGIIGYGCHVFYGSKAVRFIMGRNCNLKYGARLIHSVMGDNSTVSCCELLNTLIFPVHEQHHNTSFLIASTIGGLANIAAGATIGSNHNSRSNDGELRANRGFWPGLSVTLKHPCSFASYVIISKGDYPNELNIPLPFSLVSHDIKDNRLEIMPAYFWMYNMYALERNTWKSRMRDKREHKIQHIEMDYLAPDTAEEIINGIELLKKWLSNNSETKDKHILVNGLERNKRRTAILKPKKALAAYKTMLHYYVIKTIAEYLLEHEDVNFKDLVDIIKHNGPQRVKDWVNMGGQIVPAFRVDSLRKKIGQGKISSWNEIHAAYEEWDKLYAMDKLCHAWSLLPLISNKSCAASPADFNKNLKWLLETRRWMVQEVYTSRAKDYKDPFRQITYRNQAEMAEVLGRVEKNPFIVHVKNGLESMEADINKLMGRLK